MALNEEDLELKLLDMNEYYERIADLLRLWSEAEITHTGSPHFFSAPPTPHPHLTVTPIYTSSPCMCWRGGGDWCDVYNFFNLVKHTNGDIYPPAQCVC